jgi:hypothetical protein
MEYTEQQKQIYNDVCDKYKHNWLNTTISQTMAMEMISRALTTPFIMEKEPNHIIAGVDFSESLNQLDNLSIIMDKNKNQEPINNMVLKMEIKIKNKPTIILDEITVNRIVYEWYVGGIEPIIFMSGSGKEIDEHLDDLITDDMELPQIETIDIY